MANPNLVMYAEGGDYSSLYGSGFTTCILNSFHIHSFGISWNNTEVVDSSGNATSSMPELTSIVSGLQQNNIDVLLSIGGGGLIGPNSYLNGDHSVSDVDFMSFYDIYFGDGSMTSPLDSSNDALAMLSTLMTSTGANGIDLDPEPLFFTYGQFASATVLLTEWAQSQSYQVTWVPYTAQSSWQAYASLLAADSAGALSWLNVQPPRWALSTPQSWSSISTSVVLGFDGGTPSDIRAALAAVVSGGFTPAGAYYWNLAGIGSTSPSELASQMAAGLAPTTS